MLLDPNTWSNDGSASLGVWSVSYDGKKVAYTVKANNSDEATLYVMDVATGKKSDIDVIEGAKYAWPSWTPSGDAFYYTWLPPADRVAAADRPGYAEVRLHQLGTDPSKDKVVHEKTGDPKTFVSAGIGKDGRWLIATIEHGWNSSDVYFQDPAIRQVRVATARRRQGRPLRSLGRRGSILRLDQRGGVQVPGFSRRPAPS